MNKTNGFLIEIIFLILSWLIVIVELAVLNVNFEQYGLRGFFSLLLITLNWMLVCFGLHFIYIKIKQGEKGK